MIWSIGDGNEKSRGDTSEQMASDISVDAAVIGGGITGVLCAYLLAEAGLDTAVFEKDTIGWEGGRTARSTAKGTVAHRTIYSELARSISPEASRKYAAANLAGLRLLHRLSDAPESDMYLYAMYGERRLKREYMFMRENGIDAEYLSGSGLPCGISEGLAPAAAIRLPGQLRLDPVRLVRDVCSSGRFRVYERAEVVSAGENSLTTVSGNRVRAGYVIAATNYPAFHEGISSIKLYRMTSYAAAVRSRGGFRFPDAMAFGTDGGYGYRYAGTDGTLIVSGEAHRGAPSPNAMERLLRAAREISNDGTLEVIGRWSNNDTYTHDGIPIAGRMRCGIYTACGFGAWGMTNAASAALIIAGQITGRPLWYDDIFDPGRNFLRGGGAEFTEHAGVAIGGILKTMNAPPDRYAGEIERGQSGIISLRGMRAGAYRDDDGRLFAVSLRCPHLGCSLEWNPAALTWDCPCHGSRFSYTGECVSDPAKRGISIDLSDTDL